MSDIILVFQMGKVASTSIVASLYEKGLTAFQPHFLSQEAFLHLVKRFDEPDLTEHSRENIAGQLSENLKIYNLLINQKKYKHCNSNGESKLKIITLTREPITWYFSNFSQNYGEYEHDVAEWLNNTRTNDFDHIDKENEIIVLRLFFEDLFNYIDSRLDEISFESKNVFHKDKNIDKGQNRGKDKNRGKDSLIMRLVMKVFNKDKGESEGQSKSEGTSCQSKRLSILAKHALIYMRPHIWFKQHFEPTIGLNLFEQSFDTVEGIGLYDADFADVLLIRFEDIHDNADTIIGEFISFNDFKLVRSNISEDKSIGRMVKSSVKGLNINESFIIKSNNSEYCRKFYTPDMLNKIVTGLELG